MAIFLPWHAEAHRREAQCPCAAATEAFSFSVLPLGTDKSQPGHVLVNVAIEHYLPGEGVLEIL